MHPLRGPRGRALPPLQPHRPQAQQLRFAASPPPPSSPTPCPCQGSCKKTADPYIEFDVALVFLDLLLQRLGAYRHVLFNSGLKVGSLTMLGP